MGASVLGLEEEEVLSAGSSCGRGRWGVRARGGGQPDRGGDRRAMGDGRDVLSPFGDRSLLNLVSLSPDRRLGGKKRGSREGISRALFREGHVEGGSKAFVKEGSQQVDEGGNSVQERRQTADLLLEASGSAREHMLRQSPRLKDVAAEVAGKSGNLFLD